MLRRDTLTAVPGVPLPSCDDSDFDIDLAELLLLDDLLGELPGDLKPPWFRMDENSK